jgi:hypothetical protein
MDAVALIYSHGMIIYILKNEKEVGPMAQRRSEKPKKVKLSPKQQEFYSKLGMYKPWKR